MGRVWATAICKADGVRTPTLSQAAAGPHGDEIVAAAALSFLSPLARLDILGINNLVVARRCDLDRPQPTVYSRLQRIS